MASVPKIDSIRIELQLSQQIKTDFPTLLPEEIGGTEYSHFKKIGDSTHRFIEAMYRLHQIRVIEKELENKTITVIKADDPDFPISKFTAAFNRILKQIDPIIPSESKKSTNGKED